MIHVVLLSGGSGTRLWPLSNNVRSKQFLKVLRDDIGKPVSMVQRVFSQIEKIDADIDVTITACAEQITSIESQIEGDYSLVIEPERRDTAAAIMLACAKLSYDRKVPLNDTVIVMPIDTYTSQEYYDKVIILDQAIKAKAADLVLLGVQPTYPSEKYGYIIPSGAESIIQSVVSFREKPDQNEAMQLISEGALWNCGVFAFSLNYIVEILKGYIQSNRYSEVIGNYSLLPKVSFDYEVVEKAKSISVCRYNGDWKDLGTWNTLTEEMRDLSSGRVVMDQSCSNTHIVNELGIPLVAIGIENSVIVATPDGILVSDKVKSSFMKAYVAQAGNTRPMYEQRIWGDYKVLESRVNQSGLKTLIKSLHIKTGSQISYQQHYFRDEIWVISEGEGEIVLNEHVIKVVRGDAMTIKSGDRHAIRAITDLYITEVQIGDYLEEDDIERFGDYWRE